MKHTKLRGFSLIELLIVIVIVSIITTVAVTSYQGSVRKARRADAKADLMEFAQLLERNYTEANRFDQDAGGTAITPATFNLTQSPQQGQAFYNLTVNFPTTQSFTVTATPVAGSMQARDARCLNLTLSQTGLKGISGTGTVAECW